MIRRWEFVKGFEDYMVTDQGEVFRHAKIRPTRGGVYQIVSLSKDGKKHTVTVHRLVMEAFIGPRPNNNLIHHKDGNRVNNTVSNLEYVTRSHHCRLHPKRHHKSPVTLEPKEIRLVKHRGGDDPCRGERVHTTILTDLKVKLIRNLYIAKWLEFKQLELAELFNVSISTICKAINGLTWGHVT